MLSDPLYAVSIVLTYHSSSRIVRVEMKVEEYYSGQFFFFQAEDGIRDLVRSRGLGDVYKRQKWYCLSVVFLLTLSSAVKKREATPAKPDLLVKATQFRLDGINKKIYFKVELLNICLLYTSPSPRDRTRYRMPSSA